MGMSHRKFALGRWYMALVRRMAQNQGNFLDVVKSANEQNKDMLEFIRLGNPPDEGHERKVDGVDLAALRANVSSITTLEDTLLFGEREALELIALSAHELVSVRPFQDHPANKEIGSRHEGTTAKRIRNLMQRPDENDKSHMAKPSSWLGRVRRKSQSIDCLSANHSTEAAKNDSEAGAVDVEELFKSFTPRRREPSKGASEDATSRRGSEASFTPKML